VIIGQARSRPRCALPHHPNVVKPRSSGKRDQLLRDLVNSTRTTLGLAQRFVPTGEVDVNNEAIVRLALA